MRSDNRFFTDGEMRSLLRAVRQRASRGTLLDKVDLALVTFAWATGLGILPLTVAMVMLGDNIEALPTSAWLFLFAAGLLLWPVVRIAHRRMIGTGG